MKRIVIIVAVVALMGTAIGAVFASAATLTVSGSTLGSGVGAVTTCGNVNSVSFALDALNPTEVDSITFGFDNAACNGKTADIIVDQDPTDLVDECDAAIATQSCTSTLPAGVDASEINTVTVTVS